MDSPGHAHIPARGPPLGDDCDVQAGGVDVDVDLDVDVDVESALELD